MLPPLMISQSIPQLFGLLESLCVGVKVGSAGWVGVVGWGSEGVVEIVVSLPLLGAVITVGSVALPDISVLPTELYRKKQTRVQTNISIVVAYITVRIIRSAFHWLRLHLIRRAINVNTMLEIKRTAKMITSKIKEDFICL